MNNNKNSIFIVRYNSDTIEGKGFAITVAATVSLDDAKRIGETLPKVMGVSPTAMIYEYDIDTYESFCNENDGRPKYSRHYRLDSDGHWNLFS